MRAPMGPTTWRQRRLHCTPNRLAEVGVITQGGPNSRCSGGGAPSPRSRPCATVPTAASSEAFAEKSYYSADAMKPGTVIFWVTAMVAHLQGLRKKSGEGEPLADWCHGLNDYAQHYFKFIATRLLEVTYAEPVPGVWAALMFINHSLFGSGLIILKLYLRLSH